MGSNKRFGALKVTACQHNHFVTPLGKMGKEEAAQLIEGGFADLSGSDLRRPTAFRSKKVAK